MYSMIKTEKKINRADPSIGTTANIYRTDFFKAPEKTREGFLIVDVILGRKCVLPYKYKNPSTGEIVETKELIGDDIFSSAFLESAEGLPFVLEHPQTDAGEFVNVTPENYNQYIKGTVNNPRVEEADGERMVIATLKVFDPEVIDLILTKRLGEVSQGYFCTTENKKGVYNNVSYDAEQRNIILNHLALVSEGRAGDSVRLLYNTKANSDVLKFIQNTKHGVNRMKFVNKEGKEIDFKKLDPAKKYRINASTTNADEMIVDEEEAEGEPVANMDEGAGMASVLMEVIKMILGQAKPAPAAANSEFPGGMENGDDKLMGNSLLQLIQSAQKTAAPAKLNSDTRQLIADGVREFEKAAIAAKSILGDDAMNEAVNFNSVDAFKRSVLVKAGREESEVEKFNSAEVSAYFDVETEKSRNEILNPLRANSGHIESGIEIVRD